jgi:hypothetical protein
MLLSLRKIMQIWWERYICAEDPVDRVERLRAEARKQIENGTAGTAALRGAMQAWNSENSQSSEETKNAA